MGNIFRPLVDIGQAELLNVDRRTAFDGGLVLFLRINCVCHGNMPPEVNLYKR